MTADSAPVFEGLRVIDADTHFSEPHDLWTSRAPARWRDRVPKVLEVDGKPTWTLDGVTLVGANPASSVHKDAHKSLGNEFKAWSLADVHPASYDPVARLALMDEMGIWAQIVYPNVAGFGSQRFTLVQDPELRLLCATIFNDAMAELQDAGGGRLLPMALVPWWDREACLAEVRRAADLGLHGLTMCSDPQNRGLPDLGDLAWDPFWSLCEELELSVNFHIGASDSSYEWFGSSPWPSLNDDSKLAVGSAVLFLSNARVLANIIVSGVLERHPDLQVVSVESGIGWVPSFLEMLDYQMTEIPASSRAHLSLTPTEYFRRQIYGCFWFEQLGPQRLIDALGEDRVLFETDFPHPTCLYPDSLQVAARHLEGVDPEVQRKILQDNAARLYRIDLPSGDRTPEPVGA